MEKDLVDRTVWQMTSLRTLQCGTKLLQEPPNGTKTRTVGERAWQWIFPCGKKVG